MWCYEKRLQFPVNIKESNAKLAQVIMSQFGGPDGELAASQRYLSQRYATPYREVAGTLTDIGTEELAHMEMVSAIIYQLTKDLSMEEIKESGFDKYYVDHTAGLWPQAAGGIPFNACVFQSKGDVITDLFEDMAAEQKARSTYDNILRLVRDYPDVCEPIKFLRAREIVHFQRFGEALSTYINKKIEIKYSIQFQSPLHQYILLLSKCLLFSAYHQDLIPPTCPYNQLIYQCFGSGDCL